MKRTYHEGITNRQKNKKQTNITANVGQQITYRLRLDRPMPPKSGQEDHCSEKINCCEESGLQSSSF